MKQVVAIIGNHTDAGKTIASAIICEALLADYWKPIQAGGLTNSDSIIVQSLLSNNKSICHAEAYKLTEPLSPHIAANIDGIYIDLQTLKAPVTNNLLIVETAGGLLSPINDEQTNLDLLLLNNWPVILVANNYLGSINHTLLTAQVLKQNNIKVLGVLFNGIPTQSTESYILKYTQFKLIGNIPSIKILNKEAIKNIANNLVNNLTEITA